MTISFDPKKPLEGLLSSGANFERTEIASSSSFSINGIPVSSGRKEGTRFVWSLPAEPKVQAVFSEEGIGKKLVKIFKSELQVGDETFDKAVYIATKDKESTGQFLQDEAVRNDIFDVVSQGGTMAIEGTQVVYEVIDSIVQFGPTGVTLEGHETGHKSVEAMGRVLTALVNFD